MTDNVLPGSHWLVAAALSGLRHGMQPDMRMDE